MPAAGTALQALHQLQCGGYRNLPVLSPGGAPLGILDVLTLVEGTLFREGGPLSPFGRTPVQQTPEMKAKIQREKDAAARRAEAARKAVEAASQIQQ